MAMNRSDVAFLVNTTFEQNELGVQVPQTRKRKVFVNVSSVSGAEWFEGGRNGLNPQYRFTMFQFDYLGERVIEYNGVKYTVYRTYNKSVDEIELYTELRKGNDGKTENNQAC